MLNREYAKRKCNELEQKIRESYNPEERNIKDFNIPFESEIERLAILSSCFVEILQSEINYQVSVELSDSFLVQYNKLNRLNDFLEKNIDKPVFYSSHTCEAPTAKYEKPFVTMEVGMLSPEHPFFGVTPFPIAHKKPYDQGLFTERNAFMFDIQIRYCWNQFHSFVLGNPINTDEWVDGNIKVTALSQRVRLQNIYNPIFDLLWFPEDIYMINEERKPSSAAKDWIVEGFYDIDHFAEHIDNLPLPEQNYKLLIIEKIYPLVTQELIDPKHLSLKIVDALENYESSKFSVNTDAIRRGFYPFTSVGAMSEHYNRTRDPAWGARLDAERKNNIREAIKAKEEEVQCKRAKVKERFDVLREDIKQKAKK